MLLRPYILHDFIIRFSTRIPNSCIQYIIFCIFIFLHIPRPLFDSTQLFDLSLYDLDILGLRAWYSDSLYDLVDGMVVVHWTTYYTLFFTFYVITLLFYADLCTCTRTLLYLERCRCNQYTIRLLSAACKCIATRGVR
jgi:hypothetical protein